MTTVKCTIFTQEIFALIEDVTLLVTEIYQMLQLFHVSIDVIIYNFVKRSVFSLRRDYIIIFPSISTFSIIASGNIQIIYFSM